MRKILISILLASAAASPALAANFDWSDHNKNNKQEQQQKQQARDEARPQRSAAQPQVRQQPRPQSFNGVNPERYAGQNPRGNFAGQNARGNFAGQYNGEPYYPPRERVVEQSNAQQRDLRAEQRAQMQQQQVQERELRQSGRPVPNVMRAPHQLVVSNVPRPGTQPPLRYEGRGAPQVHWNTSWRNDGRYDWQGYREHHRSFFHLGFYYDPYGWGYTPFQIGWRLWPGYYDSQFWISDPWMYRLPYAPAGYVWVRYWNDALLVDTFSGTVVDVIPGFFW